MSDAATTAIIRDLLGIAGVALVLGLGFYAVIRAGGGSQWNCDGNVLSRPYSWPDALVGLILLGFFYFGATAEMPRPDADTPAGIKSDPGNDTGMLSGMLLMLVISLLLLAFMRIRRLEPGEMFGIRQLPLRQALLYGALALVVVYGVMMLAHGLVEHLVFQGKRPDKSMQEPVEAFAASSSLLFKLLLGLGAAVVAPVAEETIFRGYLYGITKRFSDRWFAALFTSLIFACVHRHVGSAVPLFTLAMGFAVVYEMTGCLVVPMAMHALFNTFNLVLLALASRS